ncbi:RING-H2 finger protein ATL32 [Vigna radiata var. radiata]|uniref:RING-H2 finger protein ATL32 n=1 Tax=Vigna radiata var. radiata TaxID=3916 RepID=A0A1S3V3F3_VIGRR|nr:RING-H2 finger protein ATL32 [Vigna radiata var. radiata]
MAGRLPGVGLLARKRAESNHRHENRHNYYLKESLYPPSIPLTVLDETALKARQRLHHKLGHFFSSYRSGENPRKKGGKVRENSNQKKDGGLGRKLLESSWLLRGNRVKEERKVCAVCLEELGEEQHVMNLSCSHKYHSACLLPWLAAHPHCPYCRTPVQL